MVNQVPISGTLVPRDEVQVFPQVSGYSIEALMVDIGDYVAEGDTLVRLNSQTLEAQFAQANAELVRALAGIRQAQSQISSSQASLRQAQSVLDRADQLRTSGSGTQASLDQAIANQETAAANVALAMEGLAVA
ncbi:MAG: biotin/lipoyl-binding protein [Pseudoruegeria sp.]